MPAMLVLRRTPKCILLHPLSEVSPDGRGRKMDAHHPQAAQVRYVMDLIMAGVRPAVKYGEWPTLKEAFDLALSRYPGQLDNCVLLPSTAKLPARLLIKEAK